MKQKNNSSLFFFNEIISLLISTVKTAKQNETKK
jgi:hypothetical protein